MCVQVSGYGGGGYWVDIGCDVAGRDYIYLACLFDSICVFIAVIISCHNIMILLSHFVHPIATTSNKGKQRRDYRIRNCHNCDVRLMSLPSLALL